MSYEQLDLIILDTTEPILRFEKALSIPLSQANLRELLCQILDCAVDSFDDYFLLVQTVPIYNRMYLVDHDQPALGVLYRATQQLARELYPIFVQLKALKVDEGRAVFPFGFKTLLMRNMVVFPLYPKADNGHYS